MDTYTPDSSKVVHYTYADMEAQKQEIEQLQADMKLLKGER